MYSNMVYNQWIYERFFYYFRAETAEQYINNDYEWLILSQSF